MLPTTKKPKTDPTEASILRSMRRLYRNYVKGCMRKNIYWGLSLEQFHRLTSSPCAYCDKPPAQRSRAYVYNGIDRKNNALGYQPENCVAACRECNFMKKDLLTPEETRVAAQAIKRFRKEKAREVS